MFAVKAAVPVVNTSDVPSVAPAVGALLLVEVASSQ